jgi:integrase
LRILEGSERPPKGANTIAGERLMLEKWKTFLSSTRVDRITTAQMAAFRDARLLEGCAPRTINLNLTVLRNVLNKAVADGVLKHLPRFPRFRNAEARPPARPRLSDVEFEKLCRAALEHSGHSGQLLHDVLRFLGYSGARKSETLRLLWRDVDLADGLVTFRNPKGGVARSMELNPFLRRHLEDMWGRRDPECSYVFPGPQRGSTDKHASNLSDAFQRAMRAVGLDHFARMEARSDVRLAKRIRLGFHDLRRYFGTKALEMGIDPQTASRWIGHKDGGALLLKTYAAFRAEHRAAEAQKLDFSIPAAKL